MSYLFDGTNLDQIFAPVKAAGSSNTDYELNSTDFNSIYQRLGTYSNLKYWNPTLYFTNNTDLQDVFEFNLIGDTDAGYGTYPITNGVLIYI